MATTPPTPQQLQDIHDLAAGWGKIVARRAFGDAGPGLDVNLAALEAVALGAAAGLVEGTLSTLLQQQAAALGDTQTCPDCQQPCPVRLEPRRLQTDGGPLTYPEPVCYCPACRRDFFPPATSPGT